MFPSRSLNTTITVDEPKSVRRGMGKWPVERCVYHKIAGIMFSGSPELWWLAIFNTIVGAHACSLSSWKWPPNHHLYMFTPTVEQSMWLVAIYQTAQWVLYFIIHYIVYKSCSCSSNITYAKFWISKMLCKSFLVCLFVLCVFSLHFGVWNFSHCVSSKIHVTWTAPCIYCCTIMHTMNLRHS